MKTKLAIIAVAVILVGGCFYKFAISTKEVDPAMTSLLTMPGIKPGTKDALEEVCCNSADDVIYSVKGEKITIDYGKQRFYVLEHTLDNADMQAALKRLHLQINVDDSKHVTMKYKGAEVKECAE